jgi:hypothetical protein
MRQALGKVTPLQWAILLLVVSCVAGLLLLRFLGTREERIAKRGFKEAIALTDSFVLREWSGNPGCDRRLLQWYGSNESYEAVAETFNDSMHQQSWISASECLCETCEPLPADVSGWHYEQCAEPGNGIMVSIEKTSKGRIKDSYLSSLGNYHDVESAETFNQYSTFFEVNILVAGRCER